MDTNGGNAALTVNKICNDLLGPVGGVIALMGVVVAPITSGDTAFRSARILLADIFKIDQKSIKKRVVLSLSLFVLAFFISKTDFAIIWRYFAWTNQTLAMFVLWSIAVYLLEKRSYYGIALLPAVFMTMVVVSYILIAPEGLSLSKEISYWCGAIVSLVFLVLFFRYRRQVLNKKIIT